MTFTSMAAYATAVNAVAQQLVDGQCFETLSEATPEAEQFLCRALEISWSQLKLNPQNPIEPSRQTDLDAWLTRRLQGEPLAYIFGSASFFGDTFFVNEHVLIPRPETEILVEQALKQIPSQGTTWVADLGCGSGCIGISIQRQRPDAHLVFVDKSGEALNVTQTNLATFALEERSRCVEAEVSGANPSLETMGCGAVDVVVSNPPYIPEGDPRVTSSVFQFEPHLALYGGADGLEWIHKWLVWSYNHLKMGGHGFMEIGKGQSDVVSRRVTELGLTIVDCLHDYQDIPRIIHYRKDI